MKKNSHNIDSLFKVPLEDHKEGPPDSVWDAIDKRLDKNKVVDINKKYLQLKRIAVGLLLLLLGFGAYTLNHWTKIRNQINTDNNRLIKVNTLRSDTNTSTSLQAPIKSNENSTTTGVTKPVIKNNLNENDTILIARNNNVANKDEPFDAGSLTEKNSSSIPNTISGYNRKNTISAASNNNEKNNSVTKYDEALNTGVGNRNILINKRTHKMAVINGGTDELKQQTNTDATESGNEKNDPLFTDESIKKTGNKLVQLPIIYLQMIQVAQINTGKKITEGPAFLPSGVTLMGKAARKIPVKNRGAVSATLFFAPNISSNMLKDDEHHERTPAGIPPPVDHDDKDDIRNGEQRQSSYTAGLLIDYNLNKRWSIQSGIELTSKSIHINPKTIYAGKDNNGEVKYRFNCSSGYTYLSSKTATNPVVGDSLKAFETTNTLQYFSVPLAVKYHYYFTKIDLFATAGTALNILTKGRIATEIGSGSNKEASMSNKINGLKSNYFSGNIGVGLSYAISRSIALSFMPSYNFALNSSTRGADVKTYPNNLSLAIGIRYKL